MRELFQSVVAFSIAAGPSLLMIAAFALIVGGVRLLRRGNRPKAILMIVCAAVFIGNVMILTL